MRELVVLLLVGLGTYAMRAVFLLFAAARPPEAVARQLPHVAPAVLGAIIVPGLLAPTGTGSALAVVPAVAAAAVTWVVWLRARQLAVPLIGGLVTWWSLSALIPG